MFINYTLKSSLWHPSVLSERIKEQKAKSAGFAVVVLMLLFAVTGIQAQTNRIPIADGNFSNGATFAANGWTVANEGVSPTKWALGTAASGTSQTANVTASSTAVTLTAANAGITVGRIVYGVGIPTNTFVSAITGTALTLSQAATITTASATLGFGVFSGGISVGTIQQTNAIVAASYNITLAAANPNISVGMAIAPVVGIIAANTYVAGITGATLNLSQVTLGAGAAQPLTFTATSATITGNAAYVSNDNGATNSNAGYSTNRTVYFHRDVTVPGGETAMTVKFDVKSAPASGGGWQVWAAPTSQAITGTDTQVTLPFNYNVVWPGATLLSYNTQPQVATTAITAFVPKSFAGTTFKLIFVWAQSGAAVVPPAAIDNITLTSRTPEDIESIASGLWTLPSTWNVSKVPTPVDGVAIVGTHTVMIDSKYSGAQDLTLAGTNALVLFGPGTVNDDFTVNNDLQILGNGARLNGHDGTNGKNVRVGQDVTVGVNARLDISNGGAAKNLGALTLFGSTLQTVTVDPLGFCGASTAGVNTFSNRSRVLSQLIVTNTSTASPNVIFDASVIISNRLDLESGRVRVASGKKITLGNFSASQNIFVTPGFGFTGGTVSRFIQGANTFDIQPGTEYPGTHNSSKPFWYPFISGSNLDRTLYLLPNANASPAGELAVTYTDASTVTGSLSIPDGGYTINNRYEGNWTFTAPDTSVTGTPLFYNNAGLHRAMVYANGAYEAIDGSSRLMNSGSALPGAHQEGTAQPFVIRTGLTLANLIAGPIYVGVTDGSKIASANTITSTVSGGDRNWNTPATWVGGVVPTCTNNVIIATGATVNVSSTVDAASVVINIGGTLTNNGGLMTVGCTNNNAPFYNYGTHTMTSGTLRVNGFVAHKLNSFFNQTGGDIIIDSNNNGNAATSVAYGGSSCKIETSKLALTGGKITIVDPLVNESTPISVSSIGSYTMNTVASPGTYTRPSTAVANIGATSISLSSGLDSGAIFNYVGQIVANAVGVNPVTTVTSISFGAGSNFSINLSQALTVAIPSTTQIQFSSMVEGTSFIILDLNQVNAANVAAGQAIAGPGIQAGTVVTSVVGGGTNYTRIGLSLPISGLSPTSSTTAQTLTFQAVNIGAFSTVLTAANPNIFQGMVVSGTGIAPGTFVSSYSGGRAIQFSQPIQPGAPSPLVLNIHPNTTSASGSFVYSAPINYATGINHTLQIGDGVSTQKGSVTLDGFNCIFTNFSGTTTPTYTFSLGNLIIDAPDGVNRFMSTNNFGSNTGLGTMNVQNQLTITSGSSLRKLNGNCTYYVGGNIVNNGSFIQPSGSSPLYLGNLINGVAVPTTLPQTISGNGLFLNNEYALNSSPTGYSLSSLLINNTSPAGVTLSVPNFRVIGGVTLTNGILYTSAAYPISCGNEDVANASSSATYGGGSATSYIDGPAVHSNVSTLSNINQYRLFPVGKNGKYLPIFISATGGVSLMAEAFDTNAGSVNAVNASGLSANRWKVSRVGMAGNFTGYNVRVGATVNPVTPSNIIVHSATENGIYDLVNGSATTYELDYFATPTIPTLFLTTAQASGFLGNFSYASGVACTGTPSPGATVASSTTPCGGQSITLSLTTPTTGAGVTYQWRSSVDGGTTYVAISGATSATYVATPTVNTLYACVVDCSGNIAVSNPVAVTVSTSTATGSDAIICASGPASLTAAGSPVLNWYDVPTAGTLLFSGTNYSPTVAATTTYYVASATSSALAFPTPAYLGTGASTALFNGIAFNVTNRVKLKTVTVYPKNTVALTPITVSLYDSTGNIVAGTAPVTFTPTLVTGTIGTTSQVVTLNYNIPVGTGYRLVATYGLVATTNTLGNSTAAITYPSTLGGITLTGNVTDLTTAVSTTGAITRCFHNLTFDEICESGTRTPIVVNVGNCPQVNLKLFIEGYYAGGSTMTPVKANQGVGVSTTLVDDVTVELRSATAPHALVATATAELQTNGNVSASLPAFAGSYYVAVKHRNAVQTWSATTQTVGVSPLTYDFTTAANKAFGDNMVDLGGVFGFYSGDINQDESIDLGDFPNLFLDNDNFEVGYKNTDLNGDGSVDLGDFPLIFLNSDNFIFSQHP